MFTHISFRETHVNWKSNLGPLQEKYLLLTAEVIFSPDLKVPLGRDCMFTKEAYFLAKT